MSRRRKAVFYLIALALPVIGLVLLELLLRACDAGYPTSFFLKAKVNGRDVFTDNQQFTRRYFPPGLARAPQPVIFDARKTPGTVRVFVLGESAAMGDPEPAFGFPRILEVMLRDAMPGRKVEVINAAVTAINSHVIRDIARDCAGKEGDYWIVYMGNNEVVGPFGAGTVFGSQTPAQSVIRAGLAAKRLRLGQLLDALIGKLTSKSGVPATWEGMEMFLKQQVAQDDPRMARVYANFERNLQDILALGSKAGAHLLVGTVASNLKDCPPFASAELRGHTNGPLAEWQKRVTAGIDAGQAGKFAEALLLFDGATRYFSNSAAVLFHVGRARASVSNFTAARQNLEQARDLDTLRFRADTRLNALIRETAGRAPAVTVVDVVDRVAQNTPGGLSGEELFYEHVHFNFQGNYLVARAFAEQILSRTTNTMPLLSATECARRLAFTDFDQYRVLDEVRLRLQQPPFTHQFGHEQRAARLKEQLARLRDASLASGLGAAEAMYQLAIAEAPDDWVLRENFATLLQDHGQPQAAETQWRKVIALLPHDERAFYSLANVLDTQGKSAEAIQLFLEALRRRPDSVEARNGLGLALANVGRTKEALGQFEAALREKPRFAEARVNLGQTLARENRLDEAIAQYHEALRVSSNNVAALVNLGKALASQGRHAEAAVQYRAALRVKPDNAVTHFNLGNTLNALGDAGAAAEFAEAVRCQPDFTEARYNLGLALAKAGQAARALEQFAEVVRLDPKFVEARFNFGVALAKQRRFDEAIAAFQEVLRIEPGHMEARKFLEQAQKLRGRE